MTLLQTMAHDAPEEVLLRTRDQQEITEVLRDCRVAFERWPLRGATPPGAPAADVLEHYRDPVAELRAREDMRVVDVVRFTPQDTPQWRERARTAREAFLEEHRHAEDEVRFFAHGRGCFYLHVEDRVHAVVCEAGDLLSVPAGTRHWFDMGPRPDFCAIRFFREEDGWVGDFTQDTLARRFPPLDTLLQEAR
ncbi:acireductone dioxygenase [Streptomyces sp. NPDC059740]|uniref:1,2-dihydroxy-3-keto-5-methylthiopentene dioxygenase n=1 Tax=Streptomyces sp. NPDC059740 TaxID=3346926 RepID=UPI0036669229